MLTYGGGDAGGRGLPRRSARGTACRSTTRSTPTRTTRCRPTRASPPTWPSSATGCRTARRGSRSSSSSPAARAAGPALPAGRLRLGATSRCRDNVRQLGHVRHGAITTPSTARPGGAEHQPRQHGGDRLLAGDPRLRGGRRGRLPDHRRTGTGSSSSSTPDARCWSRATAPTWPRSWAASRPSAPRAIGQAALARVLAEHTYDRRAERGGRALAATAWPAREAAPHDPPAATSSSSACR